MKEDRKNLTAWHNGDKLVLTVAAQNNNTIVVVHSVGPLILEPWIEHPNVTAVLWAGLPGQEAGNSLADVLYGDKNPSGRLPYTIAKRASDYPTHVITTNNPTEIEGIPYTEGLLIDYRYFDAKKITPRFEFGFGLSYTKFEYSNLQVSKVPNSDNTQADLQATWDVETLLHTVKDHRLLFGCTAQLIRSPSMSGMLDQCLVQRYPNYMSTCTPHPGNRLLSSRDSPMWCYPPAR
ncbi:hypothetical protein APHAL10511_003864 [Amanita phalloides]|nr:hypothetical protein APHAL10511_003864 [Amanita phalloides]